MVTMEVYCGLMGGGEKRGDDILTAESTNHRAGIQRPITYFKKIMVSLSGEIEELYVGSWEQTIESDFKKGCYFMN